MMGDSRSLLQEYERLRDHPNPQQRGYDFERLVASILGRNHFEVELNPGAARPRQVDLIATRGDDIYLIETKWQQDKANIDDVDSLYTRLDSVPPSVTGLFVSHAGFTPEAVDRVCERSSRPVVLVTGKELEQALDRDGDFPSFLRRKAYALRVHRKVPLDEEVRQAPPRPGTQSNPADLPPSNRAFVLLDGSRPRWLRCDGSFARFTFVPELQDIDWVPGGGLGATLDIVLPRQEQREFVAHLREIAGMGWVTPKGCWSIQQSTAVWHGFGADALVEALHAWERRYEGLETHHTEELCYADECDDGFYTLVAQVSADKRRIVWQAELSFQLRGIPLDTGPYRQLYDHFRLNGPVYFRPRNKNSLTRGEPPRTSKRLVIKPLAYVVALDNLVPGENDEWVAGIVVESPVFEGQSRSRRPPKWVPEMVTRSGYLICALRSWHLLGNPKSVYELWNFEWAWTSDALVVQALADWQDEPDDAVPAIAFEIGDAQKAATSRADQGPDVSSGRPRTPPAAPSGPRSPGATACTAPSSWRYRPGSSRSRPRRSARRPPSARRRGAWLHRPP